MITNQLLQLQKNFELSSIFFRRAIRATIAVFFGVLIYRFFSLTQGFWVPLTIIIVMQATTAATLRKGLQRLLGTFLGIILGSLIVYYVHNLFLRDCLLLFFLFVAYYLKSFNLINYGIFVVPLTMMVVFLVSALVPQESSALIMARLYDTGLGAVIAIVATFLVFPNNLKQDVIKGQQEIIKVQYEYLLTMFNALLQQDNNWEVLNNSYRQFEKCLTVNRQLYADGRYELHLKFVPTNQYKKFLQLTEKMGQFLFALHNLVIRRMALTFTQEERQVVEKVAGLVLPYVDRENVSVRQEKPDFSALLLGINIEEHLQENKKILIALIMELQGYCQVLQELVETPV